MEREDEIRLKLARAEEHLQSVMQTVGSLESAQCEMIPEESPQHKNYGVLRINLTPKPPAALSAVIGDFLFNVRSALDHLVWQLVIANGGTPGTSNMFPIAPDPKNFRDEEKRQRLRGVAPEAQALIEQMQPYHTGNEALQILSRLHNIDKHQTLHITTAVARHTAVEWSDVEGPVLGMVIENEELRDGAIFGDLAMPFLSDAMRERFFNIVTRGRAAVFIAFDDPDAEELEKLRVDAVLKRILDFVSNKVVPRFGQFLQVRPAQLDYNQPQ